MKDFWEASLNFKQKTLFFVIAVDTNIKIKSIDEIRRKIKKTWEKQSKGNKWLVWEKFHLHIPSYRGIQCIYNLKKDKLYGIIKFSRMKNKRRWIFILRKKFLYYGKRTLKILNVIAFSILVIIAIVLVKYKPAYKVLVDGEQVGYVENIEEFESKFDKEMYSIKNMAFYSVEKEPEYKFTFISNKEEINEEAICDEIAKNTEITYLTYAITVNGEETAYVDSVDDAEKLVKDLSKKYADNDEQLEMNIGVQEIYTQNIEEYTIEKSETVKKEVDKMLNEKLEKEHENKKHTVNGILLAQKPVTSSTITSRYGARWGTTHKGMDLAAPMGPDIYAAGDGVVEKVVNSNVGYGNLVVISHGNGIQTYYAHCSKLYVSKGQKVKSGDLIAAVGSTGDSTGPHCHFEIRIDGKAVNPQGYLYND